MYAYRGKCIFITLTLLDCMVLVSTNVRHGAIYRSVAIQTPGTVVIIIIINHHPRISSRRKSWTKLQGRWILLLTHPFVGPGWKYDRHPKPIIFAVNICSSRHTREDVRKKLSYHRETALQDVLVLAKSGRVGLGDDILRTSSTTVT